MSRLDLPEAEAMRAVLRRLPRAVATVRAKTGGGLSGGDRRALLRQIREARQLLDELEQLLSTGDGAS
jgi:hypothetical protein